MKTNNPKCQIEILILDPNHAFADSLSIALPDMPYSFKKVGSSEEVLKAIDLKDYAVILLNAENDCQRMPNLIEIIRRQSLDTTIIVITSPLYRSVAAEVINAGAADCLFTPVADNILLSKIMSACAMVKARHELFMLRQQVAMNYAFDNLVGASAEIQKIKRLIQHSLNDQDAIILSGEEGTGKNLIARIIHYHSAARNNPFNVVDCSAVTPERLKTELSALNSAKGTVFIDKLHLAGKTALLHLQNLLSSDSNDQVRGFRLIISINEPLYNMYSKGIINRKIIESVNAIEISLPPLRDRTEDVESLAKYFLRMISYENNFATPSITPGAVELLKCYDWPGNVRELENCIRRASAVSHNNSIDVAELRLVTPGAAFFRNGLEVDTTSKSGSLEENQRHLITDALDANEWNFTQTAIQLGIGRTTLWRKVRKFKLKRGAEIVSDSEPAEQQKTENLV